MKLPFVFGVHNHQPLGNFDSVIRRLTEESYYPFLKILAKYPFFCISLHVSGILLKWWEDNHPTTFELLGELISRGQIEPVVGGFFEPILAVIPREDRKEQILRHKDYIKKQFGKTSIGLWLTERVWDQPLVEDLALLGIKYVVVDDRHFLVTGFEKNDLYGYYLTEAEGHKLAVFPIDETLRYAIPFWPVERLGLYLADVVSRGGRLAVYFDDGEKFGVWPGTKKWVFEEGWLETFLKTMGQWIEEEKIELMTYAQALEKVKPNGLAYLPTASYSEMEEWALPAKRILELEELLKRLKPEKTRFSAFIRGGHWRNFFVKYPESNHLHKRMLQVSELSRRKIDPEARLDLLASQCNDAYWHGIFGGLYLPHLRQAVWQKLLSAEGKLRAKQKAKIDTCDVDYDGQEEIFFSSAKAVAIFKPSYGAQLIEWSRLCHPHNYTNVLTRRFEAYHEAIKYPEEQPVDFEEGVSSIHTLRKKPSEEVLKALVYDWYERHSLIEHFFDPNRRLSDFVRCDFAEWGDFANQPFNCHKKGKELIFFRDGGLYPPGSPRRPLLLRKKIKLEKSGLVLDVSYELEYRASQKTRCFFGVELNIYPPLLAYGKGNIKVDGQTIDFTKPVSFSGKELAIEGPKKEKFVLKLEEQASFFMFPVKTVSQSEAGFDLTTQGLAIMPFWAVEFKEGSLFTKRLTLKIT
ncbi:4-alpha-glucanotransferase [Thermodesulfatator indicus DSM 15286]|uniref:4-alpha-glucanotransferase n=1 Tax=Thermodesulfatator indicus (strain DSM 15286 / JCM 11887 / CIR29812) TaxID=667014 RepID=F8ACG7_THEID|nr:alpha-amylase/4-alpha-glucanotransferase domain-containing protein [Thermodesulfatator indicus]AEH44668.1 4-alpha-glucanotransferase [Thermodesulfatator indicus DSM 15286]